MFLVSQAAWSEENADDLATKALSLLNAGSTSSGSIRVMAEAAHERGSLLGTYVLGQCLMDGIGGEKDAEGGFQLLQTVAEKDQPDALNAVGYCYLKGLGVERDPAKAYHFFQKAAWLGNRKGMFNLGYAYEQGLGVKVDPQLALFWFRQAENQGSQAAKDHIAALLPILPQGKTDLPKSFSELLALERTRAHEGIALQTPNPLPRTSSEPDQPILSQETLALGLEKKTVNGSRHPLWVPIASGSGIILALLLLLTARGLLARKKQKEPLQSQPPSDESQRATFHCIKCHETLWAPSRTPLGASSVACPTCHTPYEITYDATGAIHVENIDDITRRKTVISFGETVTGNDPYQILGLPPSATQNQVRQAYKKLIKAYHPDRLNAFAPELQVLAANRTRQINDAYHQLAGVSPSTKK